MDYYDDHEACDYPYIIKGLYSVVLFHIRKITNIVTTDI